MNSRAFGGTFIFLHTNFDLEKFFQFFRIFKPSLILIQTAPTDMQQRDEGEAVDNKNNKAKEIVESKMKDNITN